MLATNTQTPRMFGNISPQDTPDCSLIEREPEEKYLPRTPNIHALLRISVTGRHHVVAQLAWGISGRSGRVTLPRSDYRTQFFFFKFQISSTHPLSPPPAGGGLSSLLLGGYGPVPNPRGMRKEAISSAVTKVWLGGSRFWMGGLTNHLW